MFVSAAQDDLLGADVLVCGKCHNVFHFVETFSEHKNSGECSEQKQVISPDDVSFIPKCKLN